MKNVNNSLCILEKLISSGTLKSALMTFSTTEKFADVEIGESGKKTIILDITFNGYNAESVDKKANIFISDNLDFGAQTANDYFTSPAISAQTQKNVIMRSLFNDDDSFPSDEAGSLALRGGQQSYIKSYFKPIITNGKTRVQINNLDGIGQGTVRYFQI